MPQKPAEDEQPLEEIISQLSIALEKLPTVLPLEDYITRFGEQYRKEKWFRETVHEYIGLSRTQIMSLSLPLGIGKRKTNELLRSYATTAREDLIVKTRELREQLIAAQAQAAEANKLNDALSAQSTAVRQNEADYLRSNQDAQQAEISLMQSYTDLAAQDAKLVADAKQEIIRNTDAQAIVKSQIQGRIADSPLVIRQPDGKLTYDEEKISQILEEQFLTEILEGIEEETGTGFLSNLRETFTRTVEYWDVISGPEELPYVDWVQSTILSRINGYEAPTYPYLVVAKFQKEKALGRGSIDTAIAIDLSDSMKDNGRFVMARKTAMAMHALMRRMNPKNNVYMAAFNYVAEGERLIQPTVREITPAQLMKDERPKGLTPTDDALEWILKRLEYSGPSLAYLITDGLPEDDMGRQPRIIRTIKVAERYALREYPQLRITLIDGDKLTDDIIRMIGNAAGSHTKVIPVKSYGIGGTVIKDIRDAIGEMRDISQF